MELTEDEKQLILKMRKQAVLKEFPIKKLSEFSAEEKVRLFDKIYRQAYEIYGACLSNTRIKDTHYNCYESVMELLSPDPNNTMGFWNHFNKLANLTGFECHG